jgi:hypothetical protein
MAFKNPPKTTNPSGEERRVGYEFEFTGLDMSDAAELIREQFGGTVKKKSAYEFEVTDAQFGSFRLELDAQLLREKKYETILKKVGIDLETFREKDTIEDSLMEIASSVVPFEIITPPIPISQMHSLNAITENLRKKKAEGTGSSFIYAFGLHINPEISDNDVTSILNHLRAYVLLDPWIRKNAKIDVSRRITPFINPYKERYIHHILSEKYQPDLETLIRDYFEFDNSRNRALDLLPLFMHLNEELTSSLLEDTLTTGRPTWHYRLPNCSIEDESWTLEQEWNRWVLVERLAWNTKELQRYMRAFKKVKKEIVIGFERKWIELMNRWIEENE